jgi:integrase
MSTVRRVRSGVEDSWHRKDGTPTARDGKGMRWRARYVDATGKEHEKYFGRKIDAQQWLDGQSASVQRGDHVSPADAQITVRQWADMWLEGYAIHRRNTVKAAKTAMVRICDEFGDLPLAAVRPSMVRTWIAKLQKSGYSVAYVSQLHGRLSQLLADAVHDNKLSRNPCSRRTAPSKGKQKAYICTTEQVWALHDAMPEHLRVAVLLGAFVGLRAGEACGLRNTDVDFMRGVVFPKVQYGGAPLKTSGSSQPVPIPRDLSNLLSASVQQWGSDYLVTNGKGGPCPTRALQDAVADVRGSIEGLPAEFTPHDLRHFFASLLIASGADVKTVQARLRHQSAITTLDTYGHLWPDADESTRSAVTAVLTTRLAVNG